MCPMDGCRSSVGHDSRPCNGQGAPRPSLTSFVAYAIVHPVLCQEVCPCGNPPVSCHLDCAQHRVLVVIIHLASQLSTHCALFQILSLLLLRFPLFPSQAGVEMVLRFSAPVSRLIFSANLRSASKVISSLRCHLTIRFSTRVWERSFFRDVEFHSLCNVFFGELFPEPNRWNFTTFMVRHTRARQTEL